MHRKNIYSTIAFFALTLLVHISSAQHIYPILDFKKDSAKVGEVIPVSLSLYYPKELSIVFPGEEFNFAPFEFQSREYFTTRSDTALSFDSVVYYLSTFEMESTQSLSLPVFILSNGDCTAVKSEKDSVALQFIVKEIPSEQPELKTNLTFHEVPKEFNYPYFLIGLALVFIIIIVVIVFFGRTIQKVAQLFLIQRQKKKFVDRFFAKMSQLSSNKAGVSTEEVLGIWKAYMEKLERVPYTKMTTREISKMHFDETLKQTLRDIDKNIYGAFKMENVFGHFEMLMTFAMQRYDNKVQEIKHG